MPGVFYREGFGNYPEAKLLVLQSNFAVGDQCFEEIRSRLIEETKMRPPRYVADDVDSGLPHLSGGGHRGYLPNIVLENALKRVRSRTRRQDSSVDSPGITSGMERPHCAMAHLAWIASVLGSANSFPKGTIIPQKP